MPDGRLPSIGCGNNWKYDRNQAVAGYEAAKGTLPPLQEQIDNNLCGDASLSQPVPMHLILLRAFFLTYMVDTISRLTKTTQM